MNLFVPGSFVSHSGLMLPFKIDCDALTDEDLDTLAHHVGTQLWLRFSEVHGVPSGGLRFADALQKYALPVSNGQLRRVLLVDDVLTTSRSMEEFLTLWNAAPLVFGVVIFARAPCPAWVRPIFNMVMP